MSREILSTTHLLDRVIEMSAEDGFSLGIVILDEDGNELGRSGDDELIDFAVRASETSGDWINNRERIKMEGAVDWQTFDERVEGENTKMLSEMISADRYWVSSERKERVIAVCKGSPYSYNVVRHRLSNHLANLRKKVVDI